MSHSPTPEQLEEEAARMERRATKRVGWLAYPGPDGNWSEVIAHDGLARLCAHTLNWPSATDPASVCPDSVLTEANWLRSVAATLRQQRAHDSVMATIKLDRTLSAIEREAHHLIDQVAS